MYVTLRSSTCFEQHAAHPQEKKIVSPQPLVSSPPVNSRTVCSMQSALNLHTVRLFTEGDDTRGCGDTICPPEDEQRAARNMLRIVV